MIDDKSILPQEALKGAIAVHSKYVKEWLHPDKIKPNVVGVGVGNKHRGGQPTGEPALVFLVTHKINEEISEDARIPRDWDGIPTDVLAIGHPFAGLSVVPVVGGLASVDGMNASLLTEERPFPAVGPGALPRGGVGLAPPSVEAQMLARRIRPAQGGWSVGHFRITAGTIATCVYDLLPGATVSPPTPGLGIPPKYYILSNNHVLANSNEGRPGDPILQPGPFDGGVDPRDRIATLSRFIPIQFAPQIPIERHHNLVDAAIAEGQFHDLDRSIYWTGPVRGWMKKQDVKVGLTVKKTGRTTNLTLGRIAVTNATIDVGYEGGRTARFTDQIVTTAMSNPGDSGSLIVDAEDNRAVGLLFAGSSIATIVNQFENVRSLLRVEVWP